MSILFATLRPIFDALLMPFRGLHPLVGLTLVSFLFAVFILLVLKVTSNQEKIDAVKRKIYAGLFEIRLFNDDARAILRAQWDILRHNAVYLALWMVPFLWMLVPMVLILGQLQFHYGYRALEPGQQALVEVTLADGSDAKPAVALEVPDGLRVETPSMWVPSERQLTWRIAAEEWGDYEIAVEVDGERYTKAVQVADDVRRRSPVRPGPGFFEQLLYPAETPLPAGAAVREISISYPPADGGIGVESELSWMLVLFVVSVIFAFILRKPLGVTF